MISNSSRQSSPPKSASEVLCSNLALGMHAAAQPLTVLLASLSKGLTDGMDAGELRELTASSAVHVQRVCTLFDCLQELVNAESIEPLLSATSILPLLDQLTDGVNLLFQHDGISLSATVPDTCQPALIDRARTLQALSRVLLIAHAISTFSDTVELIASSSGDGVRIVVRNLSSSVNRLNAEASLSMVVAEATMRSQHAGFSWCLRPFTVQIELQKAPFQY
jgi:hypothetical protein